jgi:chaperonin cofactor prefoldin
MEALANQADALVQKIGPDYEKLMEGLDQVDENSPDAKTFGDLFAPLDKQCGA